MQEEEGSKIQHKYFYLQIIKEFINVLEESDKYNLFIINKKQK